MRLTTHVYPHTHFSCKYQSKNERKIERKTDEQQQWQQQKEEEKRKKNIKRFRHVTGKCQKMCVCAHFDFCDNGKNVSYNLIIRPHNGIYIYFISMINQSKSDTKEKVSTLFFSFSRSLARSPSPHLLCVWQRFRNKSPNKLKSMHSIWITLILFKRWVLSWSLSFGFIFGWFSFYLEFWFINHSDHMLVE